MGSLPLVAMKPLYKLLMCITSSFLSKRTELRQTLFRFVDVPIFIQLGRTLRTVYIIVADETMLRGVTELRRVISLTALLNLPIRMAFTGKYTVALIQVLFTVVLHILIF